MKINCVVIVKLKGNKPLIFQDKIAKQVKRKGVVSFLKGESAEHRVFITKLFIILVGLENLNCLIKKGNRNGIVSNIQLNWWKFDVPGSKILSTWVIIL